MNKFDDKDYYVTSLDTAALCAIVLTLSYKHTNIIAFKDKSKAIIDKLYSLYDEENECFYKLSSKKEIKYSSLDITFYLLAFILNDNTRSEYKNLISSVYKKYLINSGLVTSWPEAPTLDDYERYRGLSLVSKDMLDESYFRMPNVITPSSSGMAPVFNKYVTYNKRKNSFTVNKSSFESSKNFLIFYLYIYLFKDNFIKSLALDRVNLSNEPESIPEILQASTSKASDMDVNYIASVSPTSTTNSNTTIEEASINTNTNIPSEENETLSENLEITDD